MTPTTLIETVHMSSLLADGTLCKNIATFNDDLQRVLTQLQLDIVNEKNRDIIGPTLLGIKHVQDAFLFFSARGRKIIDQQSKKTDV